MKVILFRISLLCMSFSFLAPLSIATTSLTDAESLLALKKSIDSDPTKVFENWKMSKKTPLCTWLAVNCSSEGRVTQLDLSWRFLTGNITFEPFTSLDMLVLLDLSGNSFFINSSSLLQLPPSLHHLLLSSTGLQGLLPVNLLTLYPNLNTLDLSINNLTGLLSKDFLSFSSSKNSKLQILDLSANKLSGPLPFFDAIAANSCTSLQTLNLSINLFSGKIPPYLGSLPTIQVIDLSHNSLAGLIPAEVWQSCGSLTELHLAYNNLSGAIPADSFSSCKWLQILDLSNNNLSGPFPGQPLLGLQSLDTLVMSNNVITGSFPETISSCTKLRVVDFSSNRLSGSIPPDLCSEGTSLEELRLPDNLISGRIPPELSKCSSLRTVDFSLNYLNGTIPGEISKLGNLEQFFAWYNGLEGEIPPEIGKCSKLKDLILNNNRLSGEIPKELFDISNLEWVSLTFNQLTGKIPKDFGKLQRLAVLQLGNNMFTGEIPTELASCRTLVWLDLNSNNLTGEIPPRLGRQPGNPKLYGLLSGNTLVFVRNVGNSCKGVGGLLEFAGIRPERLRQVPSLKNCDFTRLYSGPILSLFTQYQTLEYLDLSYNQLHGKIPDEFGDMVALQVLEISQNQLSGEIPSTLGNLKNLGVFDASYNRLQGNIPDSFSQLSFLVQIDLSNNQLTGQIPQRGQLSTLPATQYANNPGLCGVPLPECRDISAGSNPVGDDSAREKERSSRSSLTNSIVIGLLISIATVCILIVSAIVMRVKRKEKDAAKMLHRLQASHAATTWKIDKEREPLSINVATFQRQLRKLKFSQLIEATNGFSAARYVPPEYYQSFRCTAKGDVYSFGVVLLELLTGKRPTDKDDFGDTNLVGWVKMKVREGKGMEVIDSELLSVTKNDKAEAEEVKEMVRYLDITMQCVDDFPSKRPNMLQVVAMLRELVPGSSSSSHSS
ncbi:hypothetical protein SOVF_077580 [Spinacia oleracea]|nr:hypothetical protein SOVF_077580 [Spinacia oleracea]